MVNFRFFIVSLVAVFLALGIGVIMGSAVIDRAVVDRLEDQQAGIEDRINEVEDENAELRADLRALRQTSQQLADEGSQRLLDGTLPSVPVVVVAIRGMDDGAVGDLVAMLQHADADYRGTLWLTDRLALGSDGAEADLAEVLEENAALPTTVLRNLALARIARSLRDATSPEHLPPGEEVTAPDDDPASPLEPLIALRESGYLDYDPPEGADNGLARVDAPGARIVLLSGEGAALPDADAVLRLAAALVADATELRPEGPAPVVAAEPTWPAETDDGGTDGASLVAGVREDEELRNRLSTVDNIDQFAGRLATVLAIVDLGDGRYGHYGQGRGAQRLIPAPPPAE